MAELWLAIHALTSKKNSELLAKLQIQGNPDNNRSSGRLKICGFISMLEKSIKNLL